MGIDRNIDMDTDTDMDVSMNSRLDLKMRTSGKALGVPSSSGPLSL